MSDQVTMQESLREWVTSWGVPESVFNLSPLSVAGLAGVAFGTSVYLMSKPVETNPAIKDLDVNRVSVETGDGDLSRISTLCKDGRLVKSAFRTCTTQYECFQHGKRRSNDGKCLGWRPGPKAEYKWLTYSQVEDECRRFGAGLVKLGLQKDPLSFLGIYSQNSIHWFLAALGCWSYSMSVAPLYDTLGTEACIYILNQTKMSIILCDNAKKAKFILDNAQQCPSIKTIIMVQSAGDEIEYLQQSAKDAKIALLFFSDVVKLGEACPTEVMPPKEDDLALICYTSGTTGNPKGALMLHKNYSACAAGLEEWIRPLNMGPDDTHISYLPLAHVFEQAVCGTVLAHGAKIGFYQGDIKLLTDDMQALQPTIFPTVPRLLNRIYDTIQARAKESPIKEFVFNLALRKKKEEIDRGIFRNDSVWDQLAFKKIHQLLGGRVKAIFCGSAPLDPNVMAFARAAMGAYVMEGYGQTECAAVATVQMIGERACGQVGPPSPCVKIKLVDVPEMDCFARQNKGEVCIKGATVFAGYFKDPEKTKEAIDEEGWLHTGDIGSWSATGSLKIVDRKKNIFKLAQGEYIAPEKIENVYLRSSLIAQIFVHGESLKSCLIAIVVPEQSAVEKWALGAGHVNGIHYDELVKKEAVKEAIVDEMSQLAKYNDLKSFEQVKDIFVTPELWSVENDLLTPTFKVKRNALKKAFNSQIEQMYSRLW